MSAACLRPRFCRPTAPFSVVSTPVLAGLREMDVLDVLAWDGPPGHTDADVRGVGLPLDRLQTPRQVAAYVGLCPQERSSSTSTASARRASAPRWSSPR